MAEKYLGQLTAKSAPATGDILVLEDSEDTKKIDYDALANAILNKLTTKTYTVAGGTNTLIAAINALNSNGLYDRGALINNVDLNTYKNPGLYYCSSTGGSNFPTGMSYSAVLVEVSLFANGGGVCQVCIDAVGSSKRIWRRYFVNNAWSAWVKQPERDEIETLNSKMSNIAQDIRNTLSAVNCTVEMAYSARVGVVMFVALRFTTTEEIRSDMGFINGLPKAFSNYTGLQNIRLYDFTSGTCLDAYVSHNDGATTSGIFAVEDIPSGHQVRGTFSYIANI